MRTQWRGRTLLFAVLVCIFTGFSCFICGQAFADDTQSDTDIPLYPLPPTSEPNYPLQTGKTSSIASIKALPDGASVILNKKCVTCCNSGYLFVEEADRSAGIRISTDAYYVTAQLQPGNLITVNGIMGTTSTGERIVYPQTDLKYDFTTQAKIGSLGMNIASIMGWPVNFKKPDGPRFYGLIPNGLFVKVWGKVAAKNLSDDEGIYYIYLDDGWDKQDGSESDRRGIRIYTDNSLSNSGNYFVAEGVLTTKLYDPTPQDPNSGDEIVIPVIRTSKTSDVYAPVSTSSSGKKTVTVNGRIRLIGDNVSPTKVNLFSQSSCTTLNNVAGDWTPFTLNNVPSDGGLITAEADGYLSSSGCISDGETSIDIELQPTQKYIEMNCDKDTLRISSDETSLISILVRDSEGKCIPNAVVDVKTTLGSFVDSNSKEIILTANQNGFIETRMTNRPDSVGTAVVTASLNSDSNVKNSISIALKGPEINITATPNSIDSLSTVSVLANIVYETENVSGAALTFSTDNGTFSESGTNKYTTYSDDSGNATATLNPSLQDTTKVTVYYTDQCSHVLLNWLIIPYKSLPLYNHGSQRSCPLIVDLDGDGKKEIVYITSDGTLTALDSNGSAVWKKGGFGQGNNTVATTVLDTERSGLPCLFVPNETEQRLYAFNHNGNQIAGWPTGTVYPPMTVTAAIGDVNLDGSPEIVLGDECCYVYAWNPTGDWKGNSSSDSSFLWRNLTGTPTTAILGSSCALGNIDGNTNGIPNVVVGTNNPPELYAFDGDNWGDYISNPSYVDGWPKISGTRIQSSPAIGDIDGDGKNDVAVGADDGYLYVWLSNDNSWSKYYTGDSIKSSPALYDLDGDGKLDIIVGSNSGRVFAFKYDGTSVDGWNDGIQLDSSGIVPVESSPVIGDVNGDGEVEVVIGCDNGNLYALYKDGCNHTENGLPTGPIAWVKSCVSSSNTTSTTDNTTKILSAPAIDDIDGDGLADVVAISSDGVYVFHLNCPYKEGSLFPWPTFHVNNQRTGCVNSIPAPIYASIQGIVTKDGTPIANAKVYIYNTDGTAVNQPINSTSTRSYVLTVGSNNSDAVGKGAYSINQLDPNKTYNLKVEAPDGTSKEIDDVSVTTGMLREDIEM